MRLSHAYQFVDILDEITTRLTRTFPSTLEDWDDEDDRTRFIVTNPASRADEFALLPLARDLGLRAILPALLYQCVATTDCPLEPLLHGEPLARADTDTCILGYRRIVELQARTRAWVTSDTIYVDCPAWPNCASRQKIPRPALCGGMPLVHLLRAWDGQWAGEMCYTCASAARMAHEAGRREAWRQLPALFGLPPWEELLANGESAVPSLR